MNVQSKLTSQICRVNFFNKLHMSLSLSLFYTLGKHACVCVTLKHVLYWYFILLWVTEEAAVNPSWPWTKGH